MVQAQEASTSGTGDAVADDAPEADVHSEVDDRGRGRAVWQRLRRPRHPWLAAVGVVVVVLLLVEGYVRTVESHLPTVRAGDASEMIIKARQVDALAAEDEQVDVVFFGTSMMDSATSPSTVLASSARYDRVYNAAIVGAPLSTQARWADEIVLDRLEPDVIVLGLHPVDLLLSGIFDLNIRPAQANVIFARVLRETSDSPVAAVDRALHEHVAIVRQRGALRQPRTMWDATLQVVQGEPPPRFFALRDEQFWFDHLTPLGESSMFHGDPFEVTPFFEQQRERLKADQFSTVDLHKMLDLVADADAQVVVVIPPVPLTAWREAGIDMSAVETGIALIEEAAADRGIPVIDFTDRGYKNTLFADMIHSNDQGAVQFSRDLAAELDRLP